MTVLPEEMDWKIVALCCTCHRKAVTEISILLVLIRGPASHQEELCNLEACCLQLFAGLPGWYTWSPPTQTQHVDKPYRVFTHYCMTLDLRVGFLDKCRLAPISLIAGTF